jgi:hypothetical protein
MSAWAGLCSRLVAAIGLAVVLAGCLPPAGRLFRTDLPTDSYHPLPVVLGDQTGLVMRIEPGPPVASVPDTAVRGDPADPNAFVVTWLGGPCESDTALSLARSGARYALRLDVHQGFGSCPAVGIERNLYVRTSAPISADLIDLSGKESRP